MVAVQYWQIITVPMSSPNMMPVITEHWIEDAIMK
jgi:hypothetical protein